MDEKENKPSIRFAGFTDAWEQRKLNELADIIGGGTPNTNNPDYWDGNIDWYAPAEMEGQRYAVGSVRKITELGLRKSSAQILPSGKTVLFTSRAGIGKMALLQHSAATNQGFQSLVLKDGFSPYFIYSLGCNIKDAAEAIASGSTFLEISGRMLGSLSFAIPSEIEQNKIANYFRHLDDLISLHQRKHDKLMSIKKSMLEKMFPQYGADVPEIRFAGFTDVWKRRKVGNVTEEIIQYVTFQSGFPLLTSSRSGLMFQNEYRDNTSTNNQSTLFSVVPMGACTYRHMSDDDIFHFNINELVENGLVSREYPVFVSSTGNNLSTVILYLNSSPKFKAFCRAQKIGGTRTRLYYKNLCDFELLLPSEREQAKIAYFFKNLDTLITLHQRKLTKLQNIKKSCLEKMFV